MEGDLLRLNDAIEKLFNMVVLNSGAEGPLQILFSSTPDPTNQLIYQESTWECWSRGPAAPGMETIIHLLEEVKILIRLVKD